MTNMSTGTTTPITTWEQVNTPDDLRAFHRFLTDGIAAGTITRTNADHHYHLATLRPLTSN
jgi:hypothetical protein